MAVWTFVPCAMVWMAVIFSSVAFLPVSLDIKVMVTVIVALVLNILQRFMSPMRRLSEGFNTQYAAMAAYYLPSVLAFYTANSIWTSSYHNLYYVLWCVFLLMFTSQGSAEMKTYTLSAGVDQRWRLLQLILYLAWLQWGLIWSTDRTFVLVALAVYFFWTTMVWLLSFLLFTPRVAILDYNSKAFADYMRREYKSLFDSYVNSGEDPGGKYPVMLANGRIITLLEILQQRYMRLSYDTFLSYSYCQLLARRYFGFHCAEEGDVNVRDFALMELLPTDSDYERAFDIIDMQLAFLHDYFFTNFNRRMIIMFDICMQPIRGIKQLLLVPIIVLAPLSILLWSLLLFIIGGPFGASKFSLHAVASLLLALRAFFILKPGFPLYWREIWTALQNDCRARVEGTSSVVEEFIQSCIGPVFEWIVKLCLSPYWHSSVQPYWQGKIGQYSIIEDYDSRSLKKAVITWFKEQILCEVSHRSNKHHHHPVEGHPAYLTESVKARVAHTLREINGPPTNGKMSLRSNGVLGDLKWTVNREITESQTHTILIWHIATWYYSMLSMKTTTNDSDREVALRLSRYCAYLVAFHPELLPDHILHTKVVLQEVLKQARDSLSNIQAVWRISDHMDEGQSVPLLGEFYQNWRTRLRKVVRDATGSLGPTTMEMVDKQLRIQVFEGSLAGRDVDSLNTFEKGIKLGQHLVNRDSNADSICSMKVIADFWAETILYVAPSDNAAAHIELLAQGGQFVTHLWALLSNAGIFKPAAEETNPPGPVPAPPGTV